MKLTDLFDDDGNPKQNIISDIDPDTLTAFTMQAMRNFKNDDIEFDGRRGELKLYREKVKQSLKTKSMPFTGASNVSYPLISTAAHAYAAMAYPAIFNGNKKDAVKLEVTLKQGPVPVAQPDGSTQEVDFEAMAEHRTTEYFNKMLLNVMPGWKQDMDAGLTAQPIDGMFYKKVYYDSVENMPRSDLVAAEYVIMNPSARSPETAERISHVTELYPHEIKTKVIAGLFTDIDLDDYQSVETLNDKGGSDDSERPHIIIEHHCRYDLDGDGYAEPYIIWLHKAKEQALRITPNFFTENVLFKNKDVMRIEPNRYFIRFLFFQNKILSDNWGEGFADQLLSLQKAVSRLTNYSLDAMHMNVRGGGWRSSEVKMAGEVRATPGAWKNARVSAETLQKAFLPFPKNEVPQAALALLEFLVNAGEKLASMNSFDISSIAANMPVGTAMVAQEQGMRAFKAVFKRVYAALEQEFQLILDILVRYGVPKDAEVSQSELRMMTVIPVADPDSINNMEKMVEMELYKAMLADEKGVVNLREAWKRILGIMEIEDTEELIPEPPPPDPNAEPPPEVKLAMAQIALTQAQAEALNATNQHAERRLLLDEDIHALEKRKLEADGNKAFASADKDLASIGHAAIDKQHDAVDRMIKVGDQHLKHKEQQLKYGQANNKGGMGGLAAATPNSNSA